LSEANNFSFFAGTVPLPLSLVTEDTSSIELYGLTQILGILASQKYKEPTLFMGIGSLLIDYA
jgi:hypothetical protein